jgi:hypothetical protein
MKGTQRLEDADRCRPAIATVQQQSSPATEPNKPIDSIRHHTTRSIQQHPHVQHQELRANDGQSSVGYIIQMALAEPRTTATKNYPNNTLVADLSKCHENLRPAVVRATSKTIGLAGTVWTWLSRKSSATNKATTTTTTTTTIPTTAVAPITISVQQRGSTSSNQDVCSQTETKQPNERKFSFPMPESIAALNSTVSIS